MAKKDNTAETIQDHNCPTWINFLDEVTGGDANAIRTLREFMGACLDPAKRCEYALVLAGSGVGKTTFSSVIARIVGEDRVSYVVSKMWANPIYLYQMKGNWLNIAFTSMRSWCRSEEQFKRIIDGDPVMGRAPYQDPCMFRPFCRLLFETNMSAESFKQIQGNESIRRRTRCISFDYLPDTRVPQMERVLFKELEGIRLWVQGGMPAYKYAFLCGQDPKTFDKSNDKAFFERMHSIPFSGDTDDELRKGISQNIKAMVTTSQILTELHVDDDWDGVRQETEHIKSQISGLEQMLAVAAQRGLILEDE